MKLLLYVLVPVLSAAAPLAVVPVATARYGADAWASLAVALSVGLTAAVVAEFGWSIVGPQEVAALGAGTASLRLWEESLASRLVLVAALAPVCVGVVLATVPHHRGAAVLVSLGVLGGALSPAWWFTGLGLPHLILVAETLPRTVLVLGAAVAIAFGAPLAVHGAALLLAAVSAPVLAALLTRTAVFPGRRAFCTVPGVLRAQAAVAAGRTVATLTKALPTTLVAGIAPGVIAGYSAADRPMRLGLQVLAALPQRMQAWVAVPPGSERDRRLRIVVAANAGLGLVAGAVFAGVMPVIAPVLFSGTIDVPVEVSAAAGVVVLLACTGRGLGLALVARGAGRRTLTAAVVSAAIALPGVIAVAHSGGSGAAVFWALAAAEAGGVITQVLALRRAR